MSCSILYPQSNPVQGTQSTASCSYSVPIETLARAIRLLVLDVDGVMTDGGLYFSADGLMLKRFHVQDGIGIRLAKDADIEVAVITGMDAPCVARRLETLGVTEYYAGQDNKYTVLNQMRIRLGLQWSEIAYMGDDWVDLAPMTRVGLPVAVANARPEVKQTARFITAQNGGNGAIRELVDMLLTCQGKREALLERWMHLE